MNSGTTTLDAAIPQQVLAQAASWLMLMQEGLTVTLRDGADNAGTLAKK